jgi:ketosteroid isomerase-like protein
MRKFHSLILAFFFLASCSAKKDQETIEKWKNEIIETEQSFAKMAKEAGIQKAFLTYASEEAVLMRNNNLIIGKNAIIDYFENQPSKNAEVSLSWKPDFVEVAASGDLGYTYGKYVYSVIDTLGKTVENNGIFHTVWKRQPNGTWKFVWD